MNKPMKAQLQTLGMLSIVSASFSLMGCATTAPVSLPSAAPTTTTHPTTVEKAAVTGKTAEQLQSWDLHGVIAGGDGNKAWSATVYWKQRSANNYALQLFGPIGVGTLKIAGSPGHVSLVTSKGERFEANNAENLLAEQTGWRVPVSHLYYWVRGLPVPNMPLSQQDSSKPPYNTFVQDGWHVQYLEHTTVNGLSLPSKIVLSQPPHHIKLVIKSWEG